MVAYAQTEDVAEGGKAKYVSALNRIAAPELTRERVFVLTDANARAGKRGDGGGDTNRKGVGRLWPRRAQWKRQTTAALRRRQRSRSSEHFLLLPPKMAYLIRSKAPTTARAKRTSITSWRSRWTVDWSAAFMSDHPFWNHQNWITIWYTQQTTSQAGPHQTGGGGKSPRRHGGRPIYSDWWLTQTFGTRWRARWVQHCRPSPMAPASLTSLTTCLTSCFPFRLRWHRARSARADHSVDVRTLACRRTWMHHVNGERRRGRASARIPRTVLFEKAMKMTGMNVEKVRKAAVLSFFQAHVRKLEASVREGDQVGFYEHLKTMNLEGKRDRSSQLIK